MESWAKLADRIIERHQAKIILLGDRQGSQRIQKAMAGTALVLYEDFLPGFLALIDRLDLLLCNNSGPMHVACALQTPTVSTMGPTLPEKWWPQGKGHRVVHKQLPCMPCNEGYCRIKTHDCMIQISVADMLDAVEESLKTL
jgi:ADP-heptose:LPS heptosyltransferase